MENASDDPSAIVTAVALERAFRMLDENEWAWDFMLDRDAAKELSNLPTTGESDYANYFRQRWL